jgi:hypothetical protein
MVSNQLVPSAFRERVYDVNCHWLYLRGRPTRAAVMPLEAGCSVRNPLDKLPLIDPAVISKSTAISLPLRRPQVAAYLLKIGSLQDMAGGSGGCPGTI